MKQRQTTRLWSIPAKFLSDSDKPPLDEIYHHGIKGQKWGVRNGPPYPLKQKNFDPYKAMDNINKSLSKKEQDILGVGFSVSNDTKFFFNKDETAYLIVEDHHGKYKDEHPVDGKLISIAAKKEARGTGATDKLISDAKKAFKNDKLVAEIDQDNIASRKLFQRNGFKKEMSEDGVDYYTFEAKDRIKSYS